MSETPPPIPPPQGPGQPPPRKNPAASAGGAGAEYNLIADKVGLVPNVRKKDNLYQAVCVLAFLLIGTAAGWFWEGWPTGVLLGALAGLVAGTLVSGLVLMVLGLRRKS
jgi:hypothetical protein